MKHKSIGINQRIPMETLSVALDSYLDNSYSADYVMEQLRLEFKGENRLKKSIGIVNRIILQSPLADFITKNKDQIRQAVKLKHDRNVILIALLNSSYPFSFDTLQILGKFLSVQDLVNTEVIKRSLANVYGGNRATEIALYSVIPMFIEAGLISRPKQGVYQVNKELQVAAAITKQIYTESFRVNNALDSVQDYHNRDPYFLFLND